MTGIALTWFQDYINNVLVTLKNNLYLGIHKGFSTDWPMDSFMLDLLFYGKLLHIAPDAWVSSAIDRKASDLKSVVVPIGVQSNCIFYIFRLMCPLVYPLVYLGWSIGDHIRTARDDIVFIYIFQVLRLMCLLVYHLIYGTSKGIIHSWIMMQVGHNWLTQLVT